MTNTQAISEFRGASLQGNTVTMHRSLVAGGNVDKSRRSVRIGVGGFFAALLLVSAGTVGYRIDREPSGRPFFAGAQLDEVTALAVLPDGNSVPSGWRVLDGYPRPAPCADGYALGVESVYQGAKHFDHVRLELRTFADAEAASDGYTAMVSGNAAITGDVRGQLARLDAGKWGVTWAEPRIAEQPVSLQAVGADEYTATLWGVDSPETLASEGVGVHGVFRVGSTVFALDTRVYSDG